MHIPTLVTVTRDSCFVETKNSPEESHHFVSRSVVTTGLFSAAVVIGSSFVVESALLNHVRDVPSDTADRQTELVGNLTAGEAAYAVTECFNLYR